MLVPKSTTTQAPPTLSYAATAFIRRSAPTSRGLSVRTGMPSLIPGATNSRRPWKYRSFSKIHSWSCCGTTEATIAPSTSSKVIPRSRSSAAMRMASSSDVVVREVAKRKWSTSSSPRNIPKWVCVLPTSIVRSTGGLSAASQGSEARHALVVDPAEGLLERLAVRRIDFKQRLEHEAALLDRRMRHGQIGGIDRRIRDEQQVDVKGSRRVARRVGIASEVDLDALRCREQRLGIEVRVDGDRRVQEVVLPDRAVHGLRLVHMRSREDPDAVTLEGVAPGAQVRHAVAHVRAEAQPGPQSPRSFHTSTVTSSTGSGIGGSGLVARTVTASAL